QGRKKSQYYVFEGLRCSQEALKRLPQQQIIAILVTEKEDNPNYPLNKKYIITDKDFEALSQTQNQQVVLILAEKLKLEQLSCDDDFI
ncbi:RNA methyltransferase, partial [Francisella tularensis subsp. holarctica]|nr:RNA methyltransferase [Francisella tularensis subsp. holarctica]